MEEYPKTMIELEKHFNNEQSCREYLYQIRWPEGFICPRCGHQKYWPKQDGLYRCAECKYHLSVTAGTIFQDSRIPLSVWFRAIWQVVSQSMVSAVWAFREYLGSADTKQHGICFIGCVERWFVLAVIR